MSTQSAAKALTELGAMISRPGEGEPANELFNQWGVCWGSHGGYGKTLGLAMTACLRCCGIGRNFTVKGGRTMTEAFRSIRRKHLKPRRADRGNPNTRKDF